jgi:hypothetical protein
MAGVRLEKFQGLRPRVSDRLLDPMAATVADNVKLLNGELRGYRDLREITDFTAESFTVRRAYRVPDTSGFNYADSYLLFDSRDVDVIRSPVIGDSYNRHYWAGDGAPMYNTEDRIAAGSDPYTLGITGPATAPTLTPPAGSDSTRAYVYTFVTEFGEESQPSPPVLDTGDAGTWALTDLEVLADVADFANKSVTHKNIYRTVPGENSSLFFFVAQIAIATDNYDDTDADDVVALNNILESTDWAPPSATMEGWALMPNGYLLGWEGRRLMMSEPYRPHAWPAKYELALDFEIVAIGIWGSTAVIGTQSQPSMGRGTSAAAFTLQKLDDIEPCLSRQGMVATAAGVYYPSPNGLVLVNNSGVRLITQGVLTREEWEDFNPEDIFASQLGFKYIAFNSMTTGFIFNPTEPGIELIELDQFTNINGIDTDRYTGNVTLLKGDHLYDWDPPTATRLTWRWKSKLFHIPKPESFGAIKVKFNTDPDDNTTDVTALYLPYNQDRLAVGSLNTLAGHVLGGVQGVGQLDGVYNILWDTLETKQPLGGSPLFNIAELASQESTVRLIVYARQEVVLDTIVTDEKTIRVPSGFKSDLWQFELIGNTTVYSVQIATSPKELAKV